MGNKPLGICGAARDHSEPTVIIAEWKYKEITFQDAHGDIVNEDSDAIVNFTNNRLIVKEEFSIGLSRELTKDLEDEDGLLPSGTVITSAPLSKESRRIIHVVCPVWIGEFDEEDKLIKGIYEALKQADEIKVTSVAIPLPPGFFGFPKQRSAEIVVLTAIRYIDENEQTTNLKLVRFVNTDNIAVEFIKENLDKKVARVFSVNPLSIRQES